MKKIIELSNIEARAFFLKKESYCNFELPKYFDFQKLLEKVRKELDGKCLSDFYRNETQKKTKPFDCENVNYTLLNNKDGKFVWRPLQLIHPAIYVALVNIITKKENWDTIVAKFEEFQENKKIECYSIPPQPEKEQLDKATTIKQWWQQIEQRSLELALDYDYLLNTDITDCYGSIYTHTIAWALHTKPIAKKEKPNDSLLGNIIDNHIKSMSYGQTNGIPQGSVLMDFIAEIVLGYADANLSCKIKEYNNKEATKNYIDDYYILRYRDDYRIFANNQETLIKIAKLLTETLLDLTLKLNSQKTFISDNIVRDAIKPDKLYWNEAKQWEKPLQKHLLLIHSLAEKHPNSGSLITALAKFFKNRIPPIELFKAENSKVLVSILVDIAFKNPKTYPIITAILSKIFSLEPNNETITNIQNAITKKFDKIPNVGHLEIWLQRLTIKIEPNKIYKELLCQKVYEDKKKPIKIWNSDWLNENLQKILEETPIIDKAVIEKMDKTIANDEILIRWNY